MRRSTRNSRKTTARRHRLRWLLGVLVGVCLLTLAIRLIADPLLKGYTTKALNSVDGYWGSVESVHLAFFGLRYKLSGITIVQDEAPTAAPLVYAKHVEANLLWGELLHFRLAASARIEQLKATVVAEMKTTPVSPTKDEPADHTLPDIAGTLRAIIPMRIERVEVRDSELLVIDRTEKGVPQRSAELWMHHIEATAENIGTRRDLLKGQPSLLTLSAQIQRSGQLKVFITADALAKKIEFSGQAALEGLKLDELYGFLASKTGVQAPEGTLDVFTAFNCRQGILDGAIKPELKKVHLEPADNDLGNRLKAALGNGTLNLTSDRVPGREATVAIIPIKGNLTSPQAQLWPSVLTVLRNAYVSAISSGFTHLPLPTAEQKEGPAKQAGDAFSRDKFPKAQPEKGASR